MIKKIYVYNVSKFIIFFGSFADSWSFNEQWIHEFFFYINLLWWKLNSEDLLFIVRMFLGVDRWSFTAICVGPLGAELQKAILCQS